MTTTEAYNDLKNELKKIYNEREAANISDWVFEKISGLQKWQLRNNNNELSQTNSAILNNYLPELLRHKPVQYVLNEAWFYKRKFYVDENVLIPRPETEELAEWIITDLQQESIHEISIIDIGTGSGCLPVTIKKEVPLANVAAIDVSAKALSVAEKNAKEWNTEIDFFEINFLNEKEWNALQQYNIIVSNPPYIPVGEKETLAKNVRDFEPPAALFVSDKDPFIFYKKIAAFAQSHLLPDGKIYVEMHEEYADKVQLVLEHAGFNSKIKKDIYGKERMLKAFKTQINS
jgi:release factor glutamine methyltransferase